ncbi:hypothetical protein GCM10020218_100750 [Dactylosporangium vinaceum]
MDEPPTPADPLFLLLYPACAVGFALLIKRREPRRNWAAMVDAGTFTTGLGLLAWVYVIGPAVLSDETRLLGSVVQIAYPIGDLLLLAMLTRLVRSGGARGSAFWWDHRVGQRVLCRRRDLGGAGQPRDRHQRCADRETGAST